LPEDIKDCLPIEETVARTSDMINISRTVLPSGNIGMKIKANASLKKGVKS
tara:strand:- start:268 stop:420 length:153 start_codon:yes stop_codon:yes gene_type:complete